MPVHFLKLLLTFSEPIFLFNKQAKQQAANWSVSNAFFQFISEPLEILLVNKRVDVCHSTTSAYVLSCWSQHAPSAGRTARGLPPTTKKTPSMGFAAVGLLPPIAGALS
jgi:hypothetical protein